MAEATCILCPRGRYGTVKGAISGIYVSNVAHNLMCSGCSEGKYQSILGATSVDNCLNCSLGLWLETNNNEVSGSNVAATDCKRCVPGRYGDEFGLTFSNQQVDNNGLNIHQKYCKACPSGKYVEGKGETSIFSCISCEKGKFSVSSGSDLKSKCLPCPNGYFGLTTGLQQGYPNRGACRTRVGAEEIQTLVCTSDSECPSWSKCVTATALTSSASCSACAIGLYSIVPGISSATGDLGCKNCPRGRYNSETGAGSLMPVYSGNANPSKAYCWECTRGFYLNNVGATSIFNCTACLVGTYGDDDGLKAAAECKPCGVGTYLDEVSAQYSLSSHACVSTYEGGPSYTTPASVNQTTCSFFHEPMQCKKCVKGLYGPTTAADEASDCIHCPRGRYSDKEGLHIPDDCKVCSIGLFTDLLAEAEASTCTGCPTGRKGRKVSPFVRCEEGVSCNVTFCQDCPLGFFIGTKGQTECIKCSTGEVALVAALKKCTKCDAGKLEKDNLCTNCLPGFTQPTR